jgi:hypothetical protein
MSSVVISGNTSGTITLDAPAVAGTTTLTLPTTNGTVLTNGTNANFPAGSVLQVVQGSSTVQNTTSSNSFTASSLTASITPSSSANKILISVASLATNTGGGQGTYTIYRNLTNLGGGTESSFAFNFTLTGYHYGTIAMIYLDSPATTSSTTYTVYFKTQTGATTSYFGSATNTSTITLTEVKG